MKRVVLVSLIGSVALALAVLGGAADGPAQARSSIDNLSPDSALPAQPTSPHYTCYDVVGGHDPAVSVNLNDQFDVETNVDVQGAIELCLPADKDGTDIPTVPHMYCYTIPGYDHPRIVNLTTQFGVETNVTVGLADRLCAPALKNDPEGTPPADPHYKCYQIAGSPVNEIHTVTDQFVTNQSGTVGSPQRLCVPAAKTIFPAAVGDPPAATDLKCYDFPVAQAQTVTVKTQFGTDTDRNLNGIQFLCVPAIKICVNCGTGGIAEVLAGGSDSPASAADGSGSSALPYAALAGAVAAGAVAVAAGGWYARRRFR